MAVLVVVAKALQIAMAPPVLVDLVLEPLVKETMEALVANPPLTMVEAEEAVQALLVEMAQVALVVLAALAHHQVCLALLLLMLVEVEAARQTLLLERVVLVAVVLVAIIHLALVLAAL
jgi:hypothetical protein